MSSLLHPLQAASQKCRPKHQVLVLRCYPQYQKNVPDVKPNSSELSYLLYYASTRRSKLQKVGAFLEKKTSSDVWRQRLGNVQVTLHILTAIIDKCPRDLTLYADSVLAILETILRSNDINLVEESLPTFEAYCKNADVPALAADQGRTNQYLKLVQIYADFASPESALKSKTPLSVPARMRWRTASLRAIRAVVGSDAIVADSSAQLNAVMPVILDNLHLESGAVLGSLQERAQTSEKQSSEVSRKRRLSVATTGTIDTTELNPAVGTETTADADKAAEEEVRVLAVRCLKQIFSIGTSSSRGQTRLATALTLRYIASQYTPQVAAEKASRGSFGNTWAASLFEAIARWTPVQDRFVIVLTAVESLVRSPIIEAILEKQLVLAQMVSHLLKSDINLIGLSVMDVQLGLIQHMLLLLQLGGRDSKLVPYQPQHDVAGLYKEAKDTFDPSEVLIETDVDRTTTKDEVAASPVRKELLAVIERCISDLGTHIYYTDQIADMITAILARLKPSAQSDVASTTAAINDPSATTKAIADSASLKDDPTTDSFFSFATARVIALKAVKDILITANNRRTSTGAHAEVRSRVGIQVWEGTQWLLKDEEPSVRFAYVDAIITWLKLETNKGDLLLPKDGTRKHKPGRRDDGADADKKLAKRAISSASRKEARVPKTTFYQLLHLAIYDNAIDFAEREKDILLLHLLLSNLVARLGVNAVRTGLPMIMNLQNTALNGEIVYSSRAKVNIATLVHGYFWAISERFDLETTKVGHEINAQISRRKQQTTWLDSVRSPATPVDQISLPFSDTHQSTVISDDAVGTIKPFFDVHALVEEIADAYDRLLMSPPSSPPTSPGRVFSVPTLGFGYGYGSSPVTKPAPQDRIPQKVKDEMCGTWSRETCIASVDQESARSITGSKTGGSSGVKPHLAVSPANGNASGRESPASGHDANGATPMVTNGLAGINKQRYSGWSSSALYLTTSSSRDFTMRVSDLKRALSGAGAGRTDSPLRQPLAASRRSVLEDEADGESMLSWNEVDDQDGPGPAIGEPESNPETVKPSKEGQTYHDQTTMDVVDFESTQSQDVPPVPKIPSVLDFPEDWPLGSSPTTRQTPDANAAGVGPLDTTINNNNNTSIKTGSQRLTSASYVSIPHHTKSQTKRASRPPSRAAASLRSLNPRALDGNAASVKKDLAGFLAGIETGGITSDVEKPAGRKRLIAPPY